MDKELFILAPAGKKKKPKKDSYFFVYANPIVEYLSSLQLPGPTFSFNCDYIPESGSSIIAIGALPYAWSMSDKRAIDGFTHVIVDKYIYQKLDRPYYLKSTRQVAQILKKIYADFRPAKVIVNNKVMMKDFQDAFQWLGLDVVVKSAYHPISSFTLRRAKAYRESHHNTSTSKSYVIHDSGVPLNLLFNRTNSYLDCILDIPYFNWDDSLISSIDILAFLCLRKSHPFSLGDSVYRSIAQKIVEKISTPLGGLRFEDRYYKSSYSDINMRWKPSTKASVCLAFNVPYLGFEEASNHAVLEEHDHPRIYFDSINTLSQKIQCLLSRDYTFNDRPISDLLSLKKTIDLGYVQQLFCT